MTPQQHIQPLIDMVTEKRKEYFAAKMKTQLPTRKEWEAYGFTGLPDDLCSVEPPIAYQAIVQRKLRDLRIEEKELTELLATNRALQLQYEAKIVPF